MAAIVMTLDQHYADTPARAAFRAFARGLLAPVLAHIGVTAQAGEDANASILRSDLINTLGHLGDKDLIASARRTLANGSGTAEQQRAALKVAAEQADASEFDMLLDRARKAEDPLDKDQVYEALGGVEDPALAKRMIAIALSNEVPAGSNAKVLAQLASNNPDLVWTEAVPHLADSAAALTRDEQWATVEEIAGRLSDPARIAELQDYVDRNVQPDARRPFTGTIATIRDNQRIAVRVLPELNSWIADQEKNQPGAN